MDPNQLLKDAREACQHWSEGERGDYDLVAYDELVRTFEALDEWLCKGGFLPREWERNDFLPHQLERK